MKLKQVNELASKKIKTPGFWCLALIILVVAWLVWMNRGEKEIVLAGIAAIVALLTFLDEDTSILKKIISAIAMVSAAVALVWFSNGEEIERSFCKTYIYNTKTKQPLILWSPSPFNHLQRAPESLLKLTRTAKFVEMAESDPMDAYQKVLNAQVVEELFKTFGDHWDIEPFSFDSPFIGVRGHTHTSKENFTTVYKAVFQEKFANEQLLNQLSTNGFRVPAGTTVETTDNTIILKHPMFEISIFTAAGGHAGDLLTTQMGMMLGLDRKQSNSWHAETHRVILRATFSGLWSGNPRMARYKKWVNQMFEQLEESFNTSKHYDRAVREYAIMRLAPESDVRNWSNSVSFGQSTNAQAAAAFR